MNNLVYEKSEISSDDNKDDDSSEDPFKQKKILMISTHGYVAAAPPLGAPDTGGQVVYVLELSKVFAKLGYKVDIFTRQFEDQPQLEKVSDNVNIVRIPCGNKDFVPKEYMVDIIDEWTVKAAVFIKNEPSDYQLINSHYWDAGIAGMKLAEILNIPHIHTPHSIGSWKKKNMEKDFPEDKNSFEMKYNFTNRIKTENEIYKRAQAVIATTPIQTDIIENDYDIDPEKICMIPPGYDDDNYYPVGDASKAMLKERFNFKDNCILALSRLAYNKGLDLLLEGFNQLLKHVDAQLVLAVGHDNRDETEEKIYKELLSIAEKYGITDKIHFIGYIPAEELADVYRAADVFVLSSRYEPFGMTAVEAMACGTPTIVTKHGGLCRVLEDGRQALISDPFNSEEMANDMAAILKHEGISQHLSNEGSMNARDNFSWTEIAIKLLQNVKSEVM